MRKFAQTIAVIVLFTAFLTPSAAQAQGATPPTGWAANQVGWQVSGTGLNDPGCPGVYALDINHVITRYSSFEAAESFRNGRAATYWCEPVKLEVSPSAQDEPATPAAGAGAQPGETIAVVALTDMSPSEKAYAANFDWDLFFQGGQAFVFSEDGAVKNVGRFSALSFDPLPKGVFVVHEPWRAGCGKTLPNSPQSTDDDCNVQGDFLFSAPDSADEWLKSNNWTNGSVWFRPGETTREEGLKVCNASLVPAGTAMNVAMDKDNVWQVCPDGFNDPDWVVTGMMNYQPVAKAINEARSLVAELNARLRDICSRYGSDPACQ